MIFEKSRRREKNHNGEKLFFFCQHKDFFCVYNSLNPTTRSEQTKQRLSQSVNSQDISKEIFDPKYNQWRQRSSDQQLIPTLTIKMYLKKKKKTCTSGLSYSTCVISETGQPETSRVSPTYVSGIVVGDRKPKSHHVNPGNICTRSESDQITKENWPRQF